MGRSLHRRALIFKVNQLGDNVVFLPAVKQLASAGGFEKLTLWTTPLAAPLYRNIGHPLELKIVAREVFFGAWKNPGRLLALAIQARSNRASEALVAEDMGNTAYFLALMSASRRVGIRPPYLKIPFAINAEVPISPNTPAAVKAWALARALAGPDIAVSWPGTPPPPDLTHLATTEVERYDILIHPGASRAYQRWPLDRYIELASRLAKDFRVGWIAPPDPRSEPRPPAPTATVTPKNLNDLVSLLIRTRLFIGNNSGPMNLASALGVPSVIPVGPSSRSWDPYWYPERFRLLRDETLPCIACDQPGQPIQEVCTNFNAPMACMKSWTVDIVETESRTWIQKWAQRPLGPNAS